jgi:hypothetical protein
MTVYKVGIVEEKKEGLELPLFDNAAVFVRSTAISSAG